MTKLYEARGRSNFLRLHINIIENESIHRHISRVECSFLRVKFRDRSDLRDFFSLRFRIANFTLLLAILTIPVDLGLLSRETNTITKNMISQSYIKRVMTVCVRTNF